MKEITSKSQEYETKCCKMLHTEHVEACAFTENTLFKTKVAYSPRSPHPSHLLQGREPAGFVKQPPEKDCVCLFSDEKS